MIVVNNNTSDDDEGADAIKDTCQQTTLCKSSPYCWIHLTRRPWGKLDDDNVHEHDDDGDDGDDNVDEYGGGNDDYDSYMMMMTMI